MNEKLAQHVRQSAAEQVRRPWDEVPTEKEIAENSELSHLVLEIPGHLMACEPRESRATMPSWYEIYAERMTSRYRAHFLKKYRPFIEEVARSIGSQFIEIGCGAGNTTRLVREMQTFTFDRPAIRHYLVDSCPKMLGLALQNNESQDCIFRLGDIRNNLDLFGSVVHSHGVLEHFCDDEIRQIVENVRAHRQIHYVPSAKYETPSRGDERLMNREQWMEILEGTGLVRIREFNDGLDLLITIDNAWYGY